MGRDEWKTNSFPDTPAACGKTKSRGLCYTLHVVLLWFPSIQDLDI